MRGLISRTTPLAILMAIIPTVQANEVDIEVPDQDAFRGVSEDLGAAYSYKPTNPTEPLGITGFNVGIIGSYTPVENDADFRTLSGGEDIDKLGFIGLAAAKGLPFGFDVGGFFSAVPGTDVKLYGAEVKYAFVPGNTLFPAIGVRGALTELSGLDDFDLNTRSVDVSVSKGFAFLTPYIGGGRVWVNSDPGNGIALDKEEFGETKVFGGARLTLGVLQLTAEIDSVGDNTSYNLRLGGGF